MRGGDEANSAKAAAAGFDLRFQHPLDRRPQHQIGISDNAGAGLRFALCPARRHRRNPVGELDQGCLILNQR
jgi:hypothetical protein